MNIITTKCFESPMQFLCFSDVPILNSEIWKVVLVNGKKTEYFISNFGNLKREREDYFRMLNPNIMKEGYKRTKIGRRMTFVHRMVADAFIPNPENKRTVNHINGIKTDNRVENLEWTTHAENNQHGYDFGIHKKYFGKDHWRSKKVALIKDGKVIKVYECLMDTSKDGFARENCADHARNGTKTKDGFEWKFIK